MAVVSLRQVAEILNVLPGSEPKALASAAQALATEINDAIAKYSVINHGSHGQIYAYEVDGCVVASPRLASRRLASRATTHR